MMQNDAEAYGQEASEEMQCSSAPARWMQLFQFCRVRVVGLRSISHVCHCSYACTDQAHHDSIVYPLVNLLCWQYIYYTIPSLFKLVFHFHTPLSNPFHSPLFGGSQPLRARSFDPKCNGKWLGNHTKATVTTLEPKSGLASHENGHSN